jgi:hypothetical protein
MTVSAWRRDWAWDIRDPAQLEGNVPSVVEDEQDIVWLDPSCRDLPYVRQHLVWEPTRARRLRSAGWGADSRWVAYAVLGSAARGDAFRRFARRAWDVRLPPRGNPRIFGDCYGPGMPSEAVDPRSIADGQLASPPRAEWHEVARWAPHGLIPATADGCRGEP